MEGWSRLCRTLAADPEGRGHHIGVDVIEKLLLGQVGHGEVEFSLQLATDESEVLGQEQDPLTLSEGDFPRRPSGFGGQAGCF